MIVDFFCHLMNTMHLNVTNSLWRAFLPARTETSNINFEASNRRVSTHSNFNSIRPSPCGKSMSQKLKPRFTKSLNIQISSLVGCFKKINAFLVFSLCFRRTVHSKWWLDKIVRQNENDLERGFVKHWLNYV